MKIFWVCPAFPPASAELVTPIGGGGGALMGRLAVWEHGVEAKPSVLQERVFLSPKLDTQQTSGG